MLIALLSDAHGNARALAACLKEIDALGVARIYFLGDAVGYLPGGREVLDLLASNNVECQLGNHDAMLLGRLPVDPGRERIYQIVKAQDTLSRDQLRWVGAWPDHRVLETQAGGVLLVHGSPRDYLCGYVHADSDLAMFDSLPFDTVFLGHTHRPFIVARNGHRVVNVGSCGLPRDHGALLSFAILDTQTNAVVIYRLPFDQQTAIRDYQHDGVAPEVAALAGRREPGVFGEILGRLA